MTEKSKKNKTGGRSTSAPKRPGWMPDSMPTSGSGPDAAAPPGKRRGKQGTSAPGAAKKPKDQQPGGQKAKGRKSADPARSQGPSQAAGKGGGRAGVQDPHAAREARRYENPIPSREVILSVLGEADGPMSVEGLAAALELTTADRFDALGKRLGAMLRDGQLLANRRGGYAVAEKLDLVPGTVIANPEGFGFLRPEAGGDDLFLPPKELRKAMHGDRVLASVTGVDRRGRKEGAIVEVLERRLSRVMGRFEERNGVAYVTPDDRRVLQDVMIPANAREGARDGQLVVCEITEPPTQHRPPFGRILTVLGDKLTPSLVVEAAIHGHGLPHEFPQPVLDEATATPTEVSPAQIGKRADLRQLPLVTIDGEDAKDFDDAVYCEPDGKGFRLVVAIADVSNYVKPGMALDEEAQDRATSVYFPGFVVPMLPETLSNGICSLKPKVDRMCFVCDMRIDRDGEVVSSEFYEAVMRSHARLTYTLVWNAIGEDDENAKAQIGELMPQVKQLHQLYGVLARARAKRGAIEFESGETRFVLGPAGEVVQAGMLQRNDAHKLIEECMIAANVEAARFLLESGVPAPYRVHESPPENKYEDLLEFLKEFNLSLPPLGRVRPRDYTQLIRKVRERPDAALLESVLLRSQALAVYTPENNGHFGLALDAYAHFTSPIRRYPDLLVHRAIKHVLAGGSAEDFRYARHDMATLSLQCSERGRRADEASREVDERYRAAWMEQHVGSEFDGVISGVTSFGLFVELKESKVNGLVHVTQLPNDYYHFDPARRTLGGERGGLVFQLGDAVRIIVLKASLEERKIDFRLVLSDKAEFGSFVPPTPPKAKKGGRR
ncbi:ribonuclease R [Alkalisalibacterium limincola]|uniref:Ribonuclease R n=1 Tax=Alkalisalibacterium limincola TaxID=2699169 RepID=A0A5C8KV93_9GAMM|nr:ribonuclease R [Alkalisalibacterium limincola]TXK65944.1 ribonuclease R [Alkalisalibacterium limincola]